LTDRFCAEVESRLGKFTGFSLSRAGSIKDVLDEVLIAHSTLLEMAKNYKKWVLNLFLLLEPVNELDIVCLWPISVVLGSDEPLAHLSRLALTL
jgi:hypothetical protein